MNDNPTWLPKISDYRCAPTNTIQVGNEQIEQKTVWYNNNKSIWYKFKA